MGNSVPLHNCINVDTRNAFMNSFDWTLVRSFLAALDQGSLLGAARVLRTSQPTVGRHIAELEKQWGVVLFERTGRGLVPTTTALQLSHAARSMESGALALSRTLSGSHAESTGTVRLTASVPVAVQLLPPLLADMRQALPGIQVELVSSNQVSNLLRREADIAVRMVRPEQSTLVAKKVGEVNLGVFAHRSYLARKNPLRKPEDLLCLDLIGADTDTAILQGFAALGFPISREAFALRSDDLIVQWRAVQAGLGVGFLAEYMVRGDPDIVRILPGQLKISPLPMWLAVHREIRTNPRIRAVFDFLAEGLVPLI